MSMNIGKMACLGILISYSPLRKIALKIPPLISLARKSLYVRVNVCKILRLIFEMSCVPWLEFCKVRELCTIVLPTPSENTLVKDIFALIIGRLLSRFTRQFFLPFSHNLRITFWLSDIFLFCKFWGLAFFVRIRWKHIEWVVWDFILKPSYFSFLTC